MNMTDFSKRKKIIFISACVFVVCLIITAVLCLYIFVGGNSDSATQQPLSVHYIDVGQGDSVLIDCDDNYILIDAGKAKAGDIVVNYLKNLGVDKLSLVIATHCDSDHIGGMTDVINNFKIDKFLMPSSVEKDINDSFYSDMVSALKRNNVNCESAALNAVMNFGGGTLMILAPINLEATDDNDLSVVTKLTYGNSSFLFMGDASAQEESDLIDCSAAIESDIIKIGHHGSKSSSSWDFIRRAAPKAAVISCGLNNDYAHPSSTVLNTLKSIDCKYYRTDEQGTIVIGTDGTNYFFDTEK